MTTRKPYLVTAEGLVKLQKELEQLVTVGREEVADRLQRAFDDGPDDDFIDNAEQPPGGRHQRRAQDEGQRDDRIRIDAE